MPVEAGSIISAKRMVYSDEKSNWATIRRNVRLFKAHSF